MPKIILCRGIQGSGKTTWAKKWAETEAWHRVRFNWDDMRNMMGKYWVPEREDTGILQDLRATFLATMMRKGWDIVIDNMNLNPKELETYRGICTLHNNRYLSNQYNVETKDFFDVSLEECIERDSKREHPIGAGVITSTYNKYKNLITNGRS